MSAPIKLYTIGHSNHAFEHFLTLLKAHKIDHLIDVRSASYSKYANQFNKEFLAKELERAGITYVYLGHHLGGRVTDPDCLKADGRPDYEKVSHGQFFQDGIGKVPALAAGGARAAMMCAEKDPLNCHRYRLITRYLTKAGVAVDHILADDTIISTAEVEDQLAARQASQPDLFERPAGNTL